MCQVRTLSHYSDVSEKVGMEQNVRVPIEDSEYQVQEEPPGWRWHWRRERLMRQPGSEISDLLNIKGQADAAFETVPKRTVISMRISFPPEHLQTAYLKGTQDKGNLIFDPKWLALQFLYGTAALAGGLHLLLSQ